MIFNKKLITDGLIVENGDVYNECCMVECHIVVIENVKNFCNNCRIYSSIVDRGWSNEEIQTYNEIESKNDALLNIKHHNKHIRDKCQKILKS